MKSPTKSFVLGCILTLAASFVVAGSATEASALTGPERRCRTAVAKGSLRYMAQVSKARAQCAKRVVSGVLDADTDCIDGVGDERLANRLAAVRRQLSGRIPQLCSGVGLALLGYPGPCAAPGGVAQFDSQSLEECVATNTEATVQTALRSYFPPQQSFFRGRGARCIRGAARFARRMFLAETSVRLDCLRRVEAERMDPSVDCRGEIPPYGNGTGDEATDHAISRAYRAPLAGIPLICSNVDMANLNWTAHCPDPDGGAFTATDLKECLFDVNRTQSAAFVEISFPSDPVCGNAVVETGEVCDDGPDNSDTAPDACRADCTLPSCGDGVVDGGSGEECDDSNNDSGDGCTDACITEFCGDGVAQDALGEECDNGMDNSDTEPGACREDCTAASCGDGVVDAGDGEECEDGNTVSEDGCSADCKLEFCGDDVVQTGLGEECDDGILNGSGPDACRNNCLLPDCGDGNLDSGEECDDGNLVNCDGCSDTCETDVVADCGDGVIQGGRCGEECDNGVDNSDTAADACRTDCTNPICGDGVADAGLGEECDDGSANSDTDPGACRTDCSAPFCGDGVTDGPLGEECDDGSANSDTTPNACRSNCVLPVCGDGIVDSGEDCDGNSDPCVTGEACSDACACSNMCPGSAELTIFSGTGRKCTQDSDCPVGVCDLTLSRCRTSSQLDTGWTGLAHNGDVNDGIVTTAYLDCPSGGPVCGECAVAGIDPSGGGCRCAGDNRAVCDQPFEADFDDCGGDICNCYFGAPFPLTSGSASVCVVNRYATDITGTANVDVGSGEIAANLRALVFLGEELRQPCPYCGGVCSEGAFQLCATDDDCDLGICNRDQVANDGNRDGFCVFGQNAGETCDAMMPNSSFPVRSGLDGGGDYSLDCFPAANKDIAPGGLQLRVTQSTGTSEILASLPCQGLNGVNCFCKECLGGDTGFACSSDDECAPRGSFCEGAPQTACGTNADCEGVQVGTCNLAIGRCAPSFRILCSSDQDCLADVGPCSPSSCADSAASIGGVEPQPNKCTDLVCHDIGGQEGACDANEPRNVVRYCDAVLKANGGGVFPCDTDAQCAANVIGIDGGSCTVEEVRACFLDPIVAQGSPDPGQPLAAATFCIPHTTNSGINNVSGLPGPARVFNQGRSRTFCFNDPSIEYQPGVGGCP